MYSIYVFLDDKNRPYYVGKTNDMDRREKEHLRAIESGDRLPKYCAARKLIRKGIPFKMTVIRTTISEETAWRLERYFIAKFIKDGYKLYNCTSGGPDEHKMTIIRPYRTRNIGINISKLRKPKRRKRKPS